MTTTATAPLWWRLHIAAKNSQPPAGQQWSPSDKIAAQLRFIADEVERRGAKGEDRDPGETADWLRSEAETAARGER